MELVIVTGLSGAGRRSVLSALEDAGCTAIDNVPARLLEPLISLEAKLNPSRLRLAVGMDNRHGDFTEEFLPLLERFKTLHTTVYTIFVEAEDGVLLRRFSESRRPHYLALSGNVAAAIQAERKLLEPVRALSSAVIDTSRLTLSQLRQRISQLLPDTPAPGTTLRLVSFGFKYGIPTDADMVLDARFLPNPHYVPELKPLTGRDEAVQAYLKQSELFRSFIAMSSNWIQWAWPHVSEEARAYFTVAIGCTGGQHRSVALVEALGEDLRTIIPNCVIQHREIGA